MPYTPNPSGRKPSLHGGEYLLLAKGNQSALREAVAFLFSQPIRPFLFPEGEALTVNKGPGALFGRASKAVICAPVVS